ncbi:MAG: hypothetical protein SGPRY_002286 [Prymnesium sp.]
MSVSQAESDGILTDASISYADDATTLHFRASNSWLSTFVGTDPSVWLLWSHGSESLPHSFPSYHAANRGALPVHRGQLLGHSDSTGDGNASSPATNASPPAASASPPAASGSPPAASGCHEDCGADPITDYCDESIANKVAECYMSTTSLEPAVFDEQSSTYDHQMVLTNEFQIAWTVNGDFPFGSISIMMQARSKGWVGFGLRPYSSNASADASGNGMVDVDIFIGMVKSVAHNRAICFITVECSLARSFRFPPRTSRDGKVMVKDAWSSSPEEPLIDAASGHTDDLYDVGGREENGITTIWFTRALVTEDTWDYDIHPGVHHPVIFGYCRKDVDSFAQYHGPTRGFDHVVFIPVDPPLDLTVIPIAIGACLGVLLLVRMAGWVKKRLETAVQRAARLEALHKQVDSSSESSGKLSFGIVLVNARFFLRHGRLLPYETLRDLNQLKARSPPFTGFFSVLDTLRAAKEFANDQIIIFFSHQWLGWDEPDPKNVHYSCIAKAINSIIEKSNSNQKNTWVWVDRSCIPQLNPTTLGLAVSDLSEVAALASYLVVVAPPTTHCDSHEPSNMTSYQSRGWYERPGPTCRLEGSDGPVCIRCRLEQFAYVCTGKTESMLISTGGKAEPFESYIAQPEEWKQKNHTEGDIPCDKDTFKPGATAVMFFCTPNSLPNTGSLQQLLMRSLFAAILRMYLKAIGQMPPCPLRDQLLERDEEIFTNEHFDSALRDIARAKFFSVKQSNPVSRGLAGLRKTMSVCSVQSTTRISDTKRSNSTVGETVPSCKTSSFDPDNDDSVGPIPEPTVWKALATSQPQITQLQTISVEHACGNGHQNQDAELSPRIRALQKMDELNPPTNLSPSSSSSEENESGYFATPSSALRFHKWSSYMAVSPGAQSPSNILSMAQQEVLTSANLATLEDLPAVPSTPPAAEIPKLKSTNTMVSSNSGKSRWMKSTLLSSQILLRNKDTDESSHFSDGVQRRLIQKDVSSCVSAVDEDPCNLMAGLFPFGMMIPGLVQPRKWVVFR